MQGTDHTRYPDLGESPGHGPTYIEVVRITNRTTHISAEDWEREIEYTVRNCTENSYNYIFLPLREFAMGLRVFDEDGTRLNYFPNREVKDMLGGLRDEDEENFVRMAHQFKQADYNLFLQLQPNNPLSPGELRTIRLTMEEKNPVQYHSITDPKLYLGWRQKWKKFFFNVPYFSVDAERYRGHSHDEFIVIVGPPGYSTFGNSIVEGGDPAAELYENGSDNETRTVSIRLPRVDDRPYSYELEYDLIPNRVSRMRFLVLFWFIATAGATLSVIAALLDLQSIAGIGQTVSAGFLSGTLGLIFALNADWTDRYKLLSLIPLVFHAIAWAIWRLGTPGPL